MKETIYQTPKVEQERAIGCSGETKSILNTDYVQISKKVSLFLLCILIFNWTNRNKTFISNKNVDIFYVNISRIRF